MKIHVLSDLHLEFGREPVLNTPECDVVVLSGDISKGDKGVRWAKVKYDVPVMYVPGNHEFYHGEMFNVRDKMRRAAAMTNVRILHNTLTTVDNVRFIGATLWTDYELFGCREHSMGEAKLWMNDHRLIKSIDEAIFHPEEALEMHKRSLRFIDDMLSLDHDGPTVVCTHHAPSPRSVKVRFATDSLTPAFASDLDWLIEKHQPALWTHGHMHDASDYQIGNTRVVCNPFGYLSEQGHNGFREDLVIEV